MRCGMPSPVSTPMCCAAAQHIGVDVAVSADTVTLPTLCLHAAHDRLLPGRCQRHLSALLSAQATRWLDGPHLMLQARPEAAAGVVAAFMQDVCGSA